MARLALMPALLVDALTLGSGALLALAFAPFSQGWLAPLCVAVLFAGWHGARPGRAAWRGWLFGVGVFGAGVYWVYFSMHIYGALPPLLAALFTAVFVLLLALFTALAGLLAVRLTPQSPPARLLLVFPAVWVLLEWVRSWLFTGFPWLYLGYTQAEWPLAGWAPVVGVYGLSWAVAVSGAALAVAPLVAWKQRALLLALLALLWGGGAGLQGRNWTEPAGEPLEVRLLQPNVAQLRKWDPRYRQEILARSATLTREHWGVDLIVWPETAVPVFYDEVRDGYLRILQEEARRHGTDVLVGLPVRPDGGDAYYNSVLTLGAESAFYHKRHLVPFGEYIPLRSVLGSLLDILQVPMAAFSSGGAGQPPLPAAGYGAGISICYEIAFPAEVRSFLPEAAWLVNVSNNTWFGDSSAPHQVLQMAQVRAQETGRYVLSATNDGATAIVDHRGRVSARAPQFQEFVLGGQVQPRVGATPYVRWGDWPVLVALAGLGVIGFAAARRSQSPSR